MKPGFIGDTNVRCHIITPRLFVGPCPQTRTDIEQLRQHLDISAVLTLQTDADRQLYRLDWEELKSVYAHEGIEVVELPVLDQNPEHLAKKLHEAVEQLDDLLARRERVYLHCNIGNGRSPTVALAWLSWKQGWDFDEALRHISNCRDCQPNPLIVRAAEEAGRR